MSETTETASGEHTTYPRTIAVLLALIGVLALVVGLDQAAGPVLTPPGLELRLRAAARAIAPRHEDDERTVQVSTPDGGQLELPAGIRVERRSTIALLLQLEERRRTCRRLLARLHILEYLEAESDTELLERIGGLRDRSRNELAELLTVEPDGADMVLAGLGWPWLGNGSPEMLPLPGDVWFDAPPPVLNNMPRAGWKGIVREAKQQEPWPATRKRLTEDYGLEEAQLRALQAELVRRALVHAFDSPGALQAARDALQRHVSLTPGQMREVLAMAGARELMGAGRGAFPPLVEMLERRPETAAMLLAACVAECGIYAQASRAAERIGRGPDEEAEETLMRLGPFALDALRRAAERRGGRAGEAAERIRRELLTRWPEGENALDVLGRDPRLWRRWYEKARTVI